MPDPLLSSLRARLALWVVLTSTALVAGEVWALRSGGLRTGPLLVTLTLAFTLAVVGSAAWAAYRLIEGPVRLLIRHSRSQMVHQEKMAALGLLASGVAHEIGNPLTAVSSVAQLLRHRSQDPAVQRQLDLILGHIDRISKIVREMSDFSRPPSLVAEDTDPNEVLKTALHLAQYDRRARGVAVAEDLSSQIPRIRLVADHLFQVFLNLILNALDAMPEGGTLTLRTRPQGEEVTVEIADTGTGIAKGHMGRIFDPFFTTKPVGKGTGLGLSVSYGIVTSLGGRIDVRSEEGRGSSFVVRIPLRPSIAEAL